MKTGMRSFIAVLLSIFPIGSSGAGAEPLASVNGLPGATGLAVNAGTHELFVKSGISGTVWRVPIGSDGSLGTADPVSADLGTAVRIAFDLAGNLYAIQPGGNVASLRLRRLPPANTTAQQTRLSLGGFVPFDTTLTGPFAIESPGGTTNRLFFAVQPAAIYAFTLGQFAPSGTTASPAVGQTCIGIRSLAYRPRFGDLVASLPGIVGRLSIADAACTAVPGGTGFVSLEGIAWDNSGQRIFVADSGTGELIAIHSDGSRYVLATDLASPADVAYDSGHVFVAEPAAGRVLSFSADPPPTPTRTPSFSPTPSPLPSATPSETATSTATRTQTTTPTAPATGTDTETPTRTFTGTLTATATSTAKPLDTATETATATQSASPTASGTPIPTPATACPGDCNGDWRVTIDEVVLAVRIALGGAVLRECLVIDLNQSGTVTVNEIVTGVRKALFGCADG